MCVLYVQCVMVSRLLFNASASAQNMLLPFTLGCFEKWQFCDLNAFHEPFFYICIDTPCIYITRTYTNKRSSITIWSSRSNLITMLLLLLLPLRYGYCCLKFMLKFMKLEFGSRETRKWMKQRTKNGIPATLGSVTMTLGNYNSLHLPRSPAPSWSMRVSVF